MNKKLNKAKITKNDEFYTRFEDVNTELINYSNQFFNKIVYCPCDNPNLSNFTKYFRDNFEKLGIKRLVSTCYPQGIMQVVDNEGIKTLQLEGDDDFRSEECVRIMKSCDVVVTNPPFSLFKDFIKLIEKFGKKFLIIGSKTAVRYKEVITKIISGQMWNGFRPWSGGMWFICDKKEKDEDVRMINGFYCKNVSSIWFTNLERPEHEITFNTCVTFEEGNSQGWYETYDGINAINVNKTNQIPMDYDGVMGVPITFIEKFNPKQFTLLEIVNVPKINGKSIYTRLLIRKRK